MTNPKRGFCGPVNCCNCAGAGFCAAAEFGRKTKEAIRRRVSRFFIETAPSMKIFNTDPADQRGKSTDLKRPYKRFRSVKTCTDPPDPCYKSFSDFHDSREFK